MDAYYIVRVVAYSCDISSEKCGFDNPPESYWPGDYSIAYSPYFVGYGVPTWPELTVYAIRDVTYEYGSIGNAVNVSLSVGFLPYSPSIIEYVLRDNGSNWFQGEISLSSVSMKFEINIDGLSPGVHIIEVDLTLGTHVIVSFTITVIEVPSTDLIIQFAIIGVIGSLTVLATIVIYRNAKLILKSR